MTSLPETTTSLRADHLPIARMYRRTPTATILCESCGQMASPPAGRTMDKPDSGTGCPVAIVTTALRISRSISIQHPRRSADPGCDCRARPDHCASPAGDPNLMGSAHGRRAMGRLEDGSWRQSLDTSDLETVRIVELRSRQASGVAAIVKPNRRQQSVAIRSACSTSRPGQLLSDAVVNMPSLTHIGMPVVGGKQHRGAVH